MPSVLSVFDTSVWRPAVHVYVNDAATWRDCIKVSVNDAGTWRDVFTLGVIELGAQKNMGGLGTPGGSTSVSLAANGVWSGFGTTSGSFSSTWVTPSGAAGANFDVKATPISGNPNTSGTMNTFLSLGSDRSWVSTFAGGAGCSFTLDIYRASDHATSLDQVTVVFS